MVATHTSAQEEKKKWENEMWQPTPHRTTPTETCL